MKAFILTLLLATVSGAVVVAEPAAAQTVENVGRIPLAGINRLGGATGRMPDGSWRTWSVVSGDPAYLAEIDTLANRVVRRLDLPTAQGAWGVTLHTDGTVLAATYGKGELYRLRWQATAVENLGSPVAGHNFLWGVDPHNDGTACTGTFKDNATQAHLACFRPVSGTWRDYGTFGANDVYVRSTAVIGYFAYAGTGAVTPRLWSTDLRDGQKKQIALPAGAPTGAGFVYEMDTLSDRWLAVRLSMNSTGSRGYIYDTLTGTWVADLGLYAGQGMSEPDIYGNAYFLRSGTLHTYNVWTRQITDTGFAATGSRAIEQVVDANGKLWVVGQEQDEFSWRYDVAARTGSKVEIEGLVPADVAPRATGQGPDGRIYVGGYLTGGLAAFNPTNRQWEFREFPAQTEGMGTHNGKLYLGTYTGADLWEYDPAQAWAVGTNPKKVFSLRDANQDRPYAVISAGNYVAMGTEAKYGEHAGALALYDPRDGTARRFDAITGDQAVAGLAYGSGRLFAGTSIFGGNGSTPTTTNGRVFAIDPVTGTKLWDVVPIAGEKAVSSLTIDSQGHVWGVTANKIFELDPTNGRVLRTKTVDPNSQFDWGDHSGWNPITVRIAYGSGSAQDNFLYLTTLGHLWRINESSLADVSPNIGAGTLTAHTNGAKYWVNDKNLFEGRFP